MPELDKVELSYTKRAKFDRICEKLIVLSSLLEALHLTYVSEGTLSTGALLYMVTLTDEIYRDNLEFIEGDRTADLPF